MQRVALLALMGQVALGQLFTNGTTTRTSTTSSLTTSVTTTAPVITSEEPTESETVIDFPPDMSTESTAQPSSTASPNPYNVGGYFLQGCYGSPSSFPTFELVLSAESMTIDRCIAKCAPANKNYAGLFGSDCFCGNFIDDVNEVLVPEEQCNIQCPGNPRQRCGGRNQSPALKKRQVNPLPPVFPASNRFTIYRRDGATNGNNGTITTTVTVTTGAGGLGVITTAFCPSCPDCKGPWCYSRPNTGCFGGDCYKKLVCYGDWCSWDFPCYGDSCGRRLVWVDGHWRPEVCHGEECGRKVICSNGVCQYSQCNGGCNKEKIVCYGNVCQVENCGTNECNKKLVCQDGSCQHQTCPYQEINNKYTCTGSACQIVKPCTTCTPAPPCTGDKCNIVIAPPPVTQTACVGDKCNVVVVTPTPITQTPYVPAVPTQPAMPPAQPTLPPGAGGAPGGVPGGAPGGVPSGGLPGNGGKTVVTAGSGKSVASFGALAFSIIAGVAFLL